MNTEKRAANPSAVVAPRTAQIINLGELHENASHSTAALSTDKGNPLHALRANLRICVGEAEMSVGELLGAKVQQVFVLNRAVGDPVDMMLEGRVVARGNLVALDGRFAFQVTELPVDLKT